MTAHRRAIERLYIGTCSILVKDKGMVKGKMEYGEKPLQTDIPCRLSFKTITAAGDASPASPVTQTVKVFLAPEVEVTPGSKLVITQNGKTVEYQQSGQPAVYSSHQEILLELFPGWA